VFGTGLPPWHKPLNVAGGADAAGLAARPREGAARHFYSHLDVFVDGKAIEVSEGLGVDGTYVSELRTRKDGLLEVSSADPSKRYILGQLFIEWDVRLSPTYLGGFTADATHPLAAYVNGVKSIGDPGTIELVPRSEIAVVYGTSPPKIPVSYTFPP
jgi:hypothetical protein